MNLLLVEREELASDGTARLEARRARHLLDVLKVSPGQCLKGGILGETKAQVEVLALDASSVLIRVTAIVHPDGSSPQTRLVLALPRPKAIKRIVQNVACMGIARLDLINAWRVSKNYFSSPLLEPARLRQEAILGAEQGGRFQIPEIRVHRLFMPFVESFGEDSEGTRLVAHPAADKTLADRFGNAVASNITLAIGPEGGWIDREIDSLRERTFLAFRLGDSILRSEVAVTAAIAQIDLLREMASRHLYSR